MSERGHNDKGKNVYQGGACSICGKTLGYKVYHVGGAFSPICCRGCQIKFRNTEPTKTMPNEKRIELVKLNLKRISAIREKPSKEDGKDENQTQKPQ